MRALAEKGRGKRMSRSADVLPQPKEQVFTGPDELLTPEVKKGLQNTKRGYEGGMMGDRIPNYTKFLAAVKRCWPNLQEEFKIAPTFRGDAIGRIPDSIQGLAYGLSHLYTMAFLEPTAIKATVEEYKKNLLLLLKSELRMGHFASALELACILQLGLPGSRKETDDAFQEHTAELAALVKKSKAWAMGGLAKLLITDFTLDIPNETRTALLQKNKSELLRLAQTPNYGETSKLEQQLDATFGLGVLLADEATLLPNGTVRYTYVNKPEKQQPLPERPLS